MKLRKIKLDHVAVPSVYAPGYPRTLSAEEFEALIAPRNRARARGIVNAACATLALSASNAAWAQRTVVATGTDQLEREERVVKLLQRYAEVQPGDSWFWNSTMTRAPESEEIAGPVYLPRIPISFGNSMSGLFDAGAARKLAGEIFRAYGVELETGVALDEPSVHARLDGADRSRKIGFKLRGAGSNEQMFAQAIPEPANTDLEAAERAALAKAGWKLHVVGMDQYELMDGDQLTPTLAYLAGVIEFLNSVTDGPDLDLRSVLMGELLHFPVPKLEALGLGNSARKLESGPYSSVTFLLERSQTITLRFNAPGAPAPTVEARGSRRFAAESPATEEEKLPSTTGRISAIQTPFSMHRLQVDQATGKPLPTPEPMRVKLTQARAAGAEPLAIDARSDLVFVPSSFDAARPFEVEVTLAPGTYTLMSTLDVSVLRP